MTVQSAVVRVIGGAVKPLGFQRHGHSWYRVISDLYAVINVQKSRWDESCYVNIAFSPASQAENSWLPESKCQVRFRLDSLKSVTPEGLLLLRGDSGREVAEVEFRSSLAGKIGTPVAQFMSGITGLGDLKDALDSAVTERVFVHREMRSLLDSTD
ncbi:hypothetical protein SSPO_096130 [Streptomyces antimycoticus]|uniref:DUF4304 domain-containing protein n=1 Tax=Streptomyces antimycoticus TaxID=68175 RepID=A0A499UXE9_9ACTN|nr:hypothetical protein SSPO_096130 [Streptomyces antimycoticus]